MQHNLHIVSFDVPYPADYGGAIDVFYKIKALHKQGCNIYLHCYEYGRGTAPELEKYCTRLWYYKRNTGIGGMSLSLPYIISSRSDKALLKRLTEIDAPILFEGVHTTFFLNHGALKNRFKAIRVHNIEHEYYALLSQKETGFLKKTYFGLEAGLLKKYEHQLKAAQAFYALSNEDHLFFKKQYPAAQHEFIPPFHQYDAVTIQEGAGNYCLYHGNLSHPENIEAALYLLTKVFPFVNSRVIIAGKNPVKAIETACGALPNCTLVANPGRPEMDDLIANAQTHALLTFQQSGMKLKLLSALYGGRHVIVNKAMLHGTGMPSGICLRADSDAEFIEQINAASTTPFTAVDIENRRRLLHTYGNDVNAGKLMKAIFGMANG